MKKNVEPPPNIRIEKNLQRTIYDAKSRSNLPGEAIRREGDPPTGDIATDEVYDALGITYNFFWDIYHRKSVDDKGMPLVATVHYGDGFTNAFWNGRQLVIGDGDEHRSPEDAIFNRFTISLDVIAAEFVKGIIQVDTKLRYWEQSGALSESISDIFGSMVKQWAFGHTAQEADWIIGQGLFTPNVEGVGIRSLKAPGTAYNNPVLGKDSQPAHMNDYKNVPYDNGGVHINSGIPNHAFYLIATELGGYAWEKAGRIWYETLRDKRLKTKAKFYDFALLALKNARNLYGEESIEALVVKRGWKRVGIEVK